LYSSSGISASTKEKLLHKNIYSIVKERMAENPPKIPLTSIIDDNKKALNASLPLQLRTNCRVLLLKKMVTEVKWDSHFHSFLFNGSKFQNITCHRML
jgi:hypothetical protein